MTKPKPPLPPEPVWYLRSLSHVHYRQSRHWLQRSKAYRESVPEACELCGITRTEEDDWVKFHVHHLTYKHVGYELDTDLMLLCAPCHNLVHYPDSHAARHWLEVRNFAEPDLATKAAELLPEELAA